MPQRREHVHQSKSAAQFDVPEHQFLLLLRRENNTRFFGTCETLGRAKLSSSIQ